MGSQAGKVLEGPGEERSVGPVPKTVSKEGLGRGESLLLHEKGPSSWDIKEDPGSFRKWQGGSVPGAR